MEITPLFIITDFLLATVPAVSFAMLFNVPWKLLWYCAVAGGTGRIIRDISMLALTCLTHVPARKRELHVSIRCTQITRTLSNS